MKKLSNPKHIIDLKIKKNKFHKGNEYLFSEILDVDQTSNKPQECVFAK